MITEWHRNKQRQSPHLNFTWTVGDAEKCAQMVQGGWTRDNVAFALDRTAVEIGDFCVRNELMTYRASPAALPEVRK